MVPFATEVTVVVVEEDEDEEEDNNGSRFSFAHTAA